LLIQNGTFAVPLEEPWAKPLGAGRAVLEVAVAAVGRVALGPEGTGAPIGTGFLVGPDLFLTNRHVAHLLRNGQEASVDLRAEHDVSDRDLYPIAEILRSAPEPGPDAAVLRLGVPARNAQPLCFATAAAVPVGHPVASVGYPGHQDQSSNEFSIALRRIFRGIFDVKRLAPGEVLATDTTTLAHDCTNLPGSSGSAVLDLATGQVVGLDYGSLSGRNLAVPGWVVAEWLADGGRG
jgi:endonuclease G